MKRIGLIGGLSWESTAAYYTHFNRIYSAQNGPNSQPRVIVDSLDFSEAVKLQVAGDWKSLDALVSDSATRLKNAGATVLGIGANTMHKCFSAAAEVGLPVVDVRLEIAKEVKKMGASSLILLGTKYTVEQNFYSDVLEAEGIRVVKPTPTQIDVVQQIIYEELTRGIVTEASRETVLAIAADCVKRGGEVVGLCCTELAMLIEPKSSPLPTIDSTEIHARALLDF